MACCAHQEVDYGRPDNAMRVFLCASENNKQTNKQKQKQNNNYKQTKNKNKTVGLYQFTLNTVSLHVLLSRGFLNNWIMFLCNLLILAAGGKL